MVNFYDEGAFKVFNYKFLVNIGTPEDVITESLIIISGSYPYYRKKSGLSNTKDIIEKGFFKLLIRRRK